MNVKAEDEGGLDGAAGEAVNKLFEKTVSVPL